MSCPDWRRLAAARDAAAGDPPGWDDALAHLDGCPTCHRLAVAADPTLLFRRLPALAVGPDEVEAMRLRVGALRGAGSLIEGGSRRRGERLLRAWQPAVAAAVLLLALLAGGHPPPAATPGAATSIPAAAQQALAAELATQPLLEELDRPFDNVVQWNGDDLSVVLVVDERLDV